MQSPSVVVTRRAHAFLGACGLAMVIFMAVGSAPVVRAAAQSPTPTPSALFGVHPAQEGRTTLPGGHFNFALVPGQKIADAIVVENFSSVVLRFHVYGADLITALGGGLTPAQPTATMRAVGAWIVVAEPTITIGAHGESSTDSRSPSLARRRSVSILAQWWLRQISVSQHRELRSKRVRH